MTDSALPLDSGPELSFRYRRLRYLPQVSGEFETGIVGTETATEDGLLARLQGHAVFHPIPAGSVVQPFVLGGLGLAHFNGLNTSDTAFLLTFGGGVDFSVTPTVGFRVDIRGLTMNGMFGSGWTTSLHILFGGTWSF